MATVPKYEPQVNQQGFGATQNIDVRPAAYGTTLGVGVARGAGEVMDVALRIKKDQDDSAVKTSLLGFRQELTDMSAEYYSLQGANASDEARSTYLQNVEKLRKKHSKGMQPGPQASGFSELSSEYVARETDSSAKHTVQQLQVAKAGLIDAEIGQAQSDVGSYWNAPDPYLAQIRAGINSKAQLRGWKPKQRDLELQKALSAAHATAIDTIIAQDNPGAAKAYLAKYADEMDSTTLAKKQTLVDDHNDLKVSMAAADSLNGLGLNKKERRAAIADMGLTPEEQKLAEQRSDSNYAIEEEAKEDQRQEIRTFFVQAMANQRSATWQDLKRQYPEQWNALDDADRAYFIGGIPETSNPDAQLEIMGMIANTEDFTKKDILDRMKELGHQLSGADRTSLFTATESRGTKQQLGGSPQHEFDMAMSTFLGPKPKEKDTTKRNLYWQRRNIIEGLYIQRQKEYMEEKGVNKVPYEELQRILNNLEWQFHEEHTWGFDKDIGLEDIHPERLQTALDEMALVYEPEEITAQSIIEWVKTK